MQEEKIKILIVEDEQITALDLATGLEKEGYYICGMADNATDAHRIFEDTLPDIILMDINIKGQKDGIDTTIELLKVKEVPVIYITAFTDAETVNRVKGVQPAAFLTKPFNINNVRIAIELAISNFASAFSHQPGAKLISLNDETPKADMPEREPFLQMGDFVFIKHNFNFIKIKFDDLLYLQAENNYISVVTTHKKFLLRLSLNNFLEKIVFPKLVRVHRSYAVNIDCITSFNEQIISVNEVEIPLGRNYREDFLKHFKFR